MPTPKLAHLLHAVTMFCLVAIPVIVIGTLVWRPPTLANAQEYFTDFAVSEAITPGPFWAAIALNMLPVFVIAATLNQARHLFALTARGQIVSDPAARRISGIGIGLLVLALLPVVMVPAQSALLSWDNAPGERLISVAYTSADLGLLLGAGLLTLIGRAMHDAAMTAAENRAFV